MITIVLNLIIDLIFGRAGSVQDENTDKWQIKQNDCMYKSHVSHLQYVQLPSLTLLPSGSCSETNSHRCGHICQQHRACVIHWYGELKRSRSPSSLAATHTHTHTHTHTFVHCLILASSYMNAAIFHAVSGGQVGHHSCFCAEDSKERQVWTLCSRPVDQLGLSKWVKSHRNSATKALCHRVRQQLVSLWGGEDLLSGSGITVLFYSRFFAFLLYLVTGSFAPAWKFSKQSLTRRKKWFWKIFHYGRLYQMP